MDNPFHSGAYDSHRIVRQPIYRRVVVGVVVGLLFPFAAYAEPLDCKTLYKADSGTGFDFAWRKDRCEGMVKDTVSYSRQSIRISYFGYGQMQGDGSYRIVNNNTQSIDVMGTFLSRTTFYKVIARLKPQESITWGYPQELEKIAGKHVRRVGFMAAPSGNDKLNMPFTVSGSDDLMIGIASNNFHFNGLKVIMRDEDNRVLCEVNRNIDRLIKFYELELVSLGECKTQLNKASRISVEAFSRSFSGKITRNASDALKIR